MKPAGDLTERDLASFCLADGVCRHTDLGGQSLDGELPFCLRHEYERGSLGVW